MSGVPRQVQQQADEADKKAQEIVAAQNGEPTPPKAEDAPITPAAEPAPSPATPTAEPAPTPAQADNPDADPNGQTWEHRYKTLNGMFKAEVKRSVDQAQATVKAQLDAYQSQIQALQAQVTALMTTPKAAGQGDPAPAATPQATGKRVWTEDFRR